MSLGILPLTFEHAAFSAVCRHLTVRERLTLKARALTDFGAAVYDAVRLGVVRIEGPHACAGPLDDAAIESLVERAGLDAVAELGACILNAAQLDGRDEKKSPSPSP